MNQVSGPGVLVELVEAKITQFLVRKHLMANPTKPQSSTSSAPPGTGTLLTQEDRVQGISSLSGSTAIVVSDFFDNFPNASSNHCSNDSSNGRLRSLRTARRSSGARPRISSSMACRAAIRSTDGCVNRIWRRIDFSKNQVMAYCAHAMTQPTTLAELKKLDPEVLAATGRKRVLDETNRLSQNSTPVKRAHR
jgi:hypothetical protein